MPKTLHIHQFLHNDKNLLRKDANYWRGQLEYLTRLYDSTCVEDEVNKENKATVCAKLSGLGMAMCLHFSSAVQALGGEHKSGCIEAAMSTCDSAERFYASLELLAKEKLN